MILFPFLRTSIPGLIYRALPSVADLFFLQAINKRVGNMGIGTPLLSPADVYFTAHQQGMEARNLVTIPEQDTWLYNTTRYGQWVLSRSMVCCTFVCAMHKAAGTFGDLAEKINCGEFTIPDDYSLTALAQPTPLPQQCDSGSSSFLCQLSGGNAIMLDQAKFAFATPYAHMYENCGGHAPDFKRQERC
jgi:hypothetical protein